MEEIVMRRIAILIEGLPIPMQTPETAAAVEQYVNVRLFLYHHLEMPPLVSIRHGNESDEVAISVLSDETDLHRDIARFTEQALRTQFLKSARHPLPCRIHV